MSLLTHLRSLDPSTLAALMTARGVAASRFQSLEGLVRALDEPGSVSAALDRLDARALGVTSLLVGGDPVATVAGLRDRLGPDDAAAALGDLTAVGLAWAGPNGGLGHAAPLAELVDRVDHPSIMTLPRACLERLLMVWGVHAPSGLVAAMQSDETVQAVLLDTCDLARRLWEGLDARGSLVAEQHVERAAGRTVAGYGRSGYGRSGYGRSGYGGDEDGYQDEWEGYDPGPHDPVHELAELGLVVPRSCPTGYAYEHVLPRELVRDEVRVAPAVPAVEGAPWPAGGLTAAGAQALERLRTGAVRLLDELGRTPVPTRRHGGVGTPQQRRLAGVLGWSQAEVRWLLTLLREARLIETGASQVSVPAGAFLAADPHEQTATLLTAALASRGPLGVGDDGAPAAGEPVRELPAWVAARHRVLSLLAELPDSRRTEEQAAAWLAWKRPRTWTVSGWPPVDLLAAALAELRLTGLVAEGCVTPLGRAVLADADTCPVLLAAAPALERTALFQADLTATVLGTPDARLTRTLDDAGVREGSDGPAGGRPDAATVWRFTSDTVRAALDRGADGAELRSALAAVAAAPLPAALERLLDDVERAYGAVKVAGPTTVLVTRDAAAAELLLRTDALRRLHLTRLGAEVLASVLGPDATTSALRKAGLAPVALVPVPVAPRAGSPGAPLRVVRPRLHGLPRPASAPERSLAVAERLLATSSEPLRLSTAQR